MKFRIVQRAGDCGTIIESFHVSRDQQDPGPIIDEPVLADRGSAPLDGDDLLMVIHQPNCGLVRRAELTIGPAKIGDMRMLRTVVGGATD